ncbi:hypothetical protein [Roseateles sp.]|uniref:hypothetical protein n=1 Tax=Roseateles sp. TaxID=1971397 RepID=UPI0025F0ADB6|nr:hypothetical protein [Roseateles sp.]
MDTHGKRSVGPDRPALHLFDAMVKASHHLRSSWKTARFAFSIPGSSRASERRCMPMSGLACFVCFVCFVRFVR